MTTINPVPMTQTQAPAFRGKEKFLSKVKRNIFFSPTKQEYVKQVLEAPRSPEHKKALLVNQAISSPNIFKNIAGNLKRIFSKKNI